MNARSLRHAIELLLTRAALAVVPRLPRGIVVGLARGIGALVAVAARGERAVCLANLDIAFGSSKSPSEKRRIVRRSFQAFALVLLDLFWFSRHTKARIRAHVSVEPERDPGMFGPGARVCITAHYGNWEVLGMTISQHGAPLTSVAAPLANRRLDRLFISLREATGQRILSKHGALRGLLATLRGGGKIGLVLDQNTRPSAGGIFVTFFGLPALMALGPASIALRTGTPVVLTTIACDDTGRYHMPPSIPIPTDGIDPSSPDAEREFTQRIASTLESVLREAPDQWLWMYKRWKYIPPGHDGTGLPFYAKTLNRKDREALA